MITEKVVQQFQEMYFKRFGKKISYGEAVEYGMKLITLARIVYKPVKKKDLLTITNKIKQYE